MKPSFKHLPILLAVAFILILLLSVASGAPTYNFHPVIPSDPPAAMGSGIAVLFN